MKLIFFLVAFCLITIRVYFAWAGKDRASRGLSEANMEIRSDNLNETMRYSGKFQIAGDEQSFKSISPGGFLKFRRNELRVSAESNLKGEIEYILYDGSRRLSPGEAAGQALIASAIHEMIAWGFDPDAHMDRVYRRGGATALLNEVDSMHSDEVKMRYLDRLFSLDSGYLPLLIEKTGSLGSDRDKASYLNRISSIQLRDSATASAFFAMLENMGSDMDKRNLLQHLADQDSVSEKNIERIIGIGGRLGSDMDKSAVFAKLLDEGLHGALLDSLMNQIAFMGSDRDKADLYGKIPEEKSMTEPQWIKLIGQVSQLGSDMDKANMLTAIAEKMPYSEPVKAAYLNAAKTIDDDGDYGRVMRAAESSGEDRPRQ